MSGQARVVIADDPDVGRVTTAFPRRAGFDVVVASSGAEALATLLGVDLSPAALVTDDAMAGLNGAGPGEAGT